MSNIVDFMTENNNNNSSKKKKRKENDFQESNFFLNQDYCIN